MALTKHNMIRIPVNSTVLLSFSGGADSLVLLSQLLSKGNIVYTCYVEGCQGELKSIVEKKYRKKALEYFEVHYPEHLKVDKIIKISSAVIVDETERKITNYPVFFGQPIDWLYGIVNLLRTINAKIDYVVQGYLATDQFSVFAEEASLVFDNLCSFTLQPDFNKPELMFPFLLYRKYDVLERLYEDKLDHLAWWCETPGFKGANLVEVPCGLCPACKTHYFAHLQYRTMHRPVEQIEDMMFNMPEQNSRNPDQFDLFEESIQLTEDSPKEDIDNGTDPGRENEVECIAVEVG